MENQSPAPPVLFRPVPMQRVRHDSWTPSRQELFLIYLEQLGIVSFAARAVGMSPKSAYVLLKRSEAMQPADGEAPTFAQAWRNAVQTGHDNAMGLAIDRAVNGELRPVFNRGRQVSERRVFDNQMLIAALRVHRRGGAGNVDPDALWSFLNGGSA